MLVSAGRARSNDQDYSFFNVRFISYTIPYILRLNRQLSNEGSLIAFFQKKVVSLIDDYASRLNLPVQVIIEAKLIAERSIVKDIALGYRPEEVAAVSIYVACRRNKVPLSFREVVKTTRVSRVKLGNLYKRILIHLDVKMPLSSPEDYLYKRLVPLLEVKNEVVSRAKDIIEKLRNRGLAGGKNPGAVAAAALYIASLSLKQPVRISRLAKAAGVTTVTIKNVTKSLTRALNL